ncbi:hypothetical protein JTE90_014131 [Oedothorax gibbosus]|uniref:Transposable element P transposase-like GTP-binding insertion domain-containing protein n=1 Tax=Oedothorax gibbosus TaxID=931172 RepID=A0AAV6TFG8_9ARAC|nr:hypothetical protein JTE90_014131 [Oedothorax gibbosus]
MAKCLGATLELPDPVPWFPHPADTQENVHIILDVCHMLKLIRNCPATLEFFKFDGKRIEWRYIKELHRIQEEEDAVLAKKYDLDVRQPIAYDHDLNRFSLNIISYIAGYVVRSVESKIHCEVCIGTLQKGDTPTVNPIQLLMRKTRGGLVLPDQMVTGGPSKDDTYGLQPRFAVLNPAAEATLPQPSVPLIDRMANSEAMLLS